MSGLTAEHILAHAPNDHYGAPRRRLACPKSWRAGCELAALDVESFPVALPTAPPGSPTRSVVMLGTLAQHADQRGG